MNLFFYSLIKMMIHHLIKMTQITHNKHNNKILTWYCIFWTPIYVWWSYKNIHDNYIKFWYCSK